MEFSYGDGDVKKSFKNLKRHYILELGTLEGEKNGRFVSTDDDKDESIDARVYRVNYDSLKKLYYILNKNPLYLSKISDSYLSGNVHAVENTTLFTSIPYDEGWSVYVDGKKAEKIKLLDAFIGLKLEKGQHEIEFKYVSSGIIEGAIISAASLALLLLICLVKKVIENGGIKFKKKEVIEDDEFEELDIEDSEEDDDDEDEEDEEDDDTEQANFNNIIKIDTAIAGGKGVVDLLTKNCNSETDADENSNDDNLK